MYASQLVADYWTSMGDLVDSYWMPEGVENQVWWNNAICEQGDLFHDIIQRGLWMAGVLHEEHDGVEKFIDEESGEEKTKPCFKEVKVVDDFYNIRGKIDLILGCPSILKKNWAKTPPKEMLEVDKFAVDDIKTLFKDKFDKIIDANDEALSDKYKAQLTFYHDFAVKKKWVEKNSIPALHFVCRDDIRKSKYVQYEPENRIRDLIKDNAVEFWTHIRERSHPDKKDYEKFTEEMVKTQPDREFNLPECVK